MSHRDSRYRSLVAAIERLQKVDSINVFLHRRARGGKFCIIGDGPRVITRAGKPGQEPEAEITITRHLGCTGYPDPDYVTDQLAADVFSASIKDAESQELIPGLIVKALDAHSRFVTSELVREFELEGEYHVQAEKAQGTSLPRYIGMFTSDSLYFLLFEDAGRWLTDEECESKALGVEALQAFNTVVETGVIPWVNMRSKVRRGRDGRLKFVSLWKCGTRTEYTPEYMAKLPPGSAASTPDELFQADVRSCRKAMLDEIDFSK